MSNSQEEPIFEEALKRPSQGERLAFLDEACRGNPELRARLDLLLEGYFKAEGFLTREPELHGELPDEAPGSKIGRYKLLERLGEGGFGVVYVAEQTEPVKRRVALKVIKPGMDTRQVVARFEAERQAVALMDHPNIAKVFDGGTTETGRPYFVMELVRGVPITKYSQENELAIDERLKLFVLVCQAVQHAHQKGIIHRDLKPSNILVTVNDGVAVPKVIDFGVAKATQQELTEKTIFTQFHHFIGTPAYMSPEQAEMTSVDIDTRSDIYSLGVLLYELLTGKPPFDGKELLASGLEAMRRTIREIEPLRPSTRVARERSSVVKSKIQNLKSEIDQDLDWIVMKCLEKDRARRYDTANSLVSDIERHLNDETVVARPPSATYRCQKLVRRHKLAFAAAAAVGFALVAGVSIASWQAVRAMRAERSTRAVKDFLLHQALRANPYVEPVPDPARATQLERMAQAVDLRFTNQPLIEAELRMALGGGFCALTDYSNGFLQFRKALDIRRRLLGPRHSDTLWSLSFVVSVQIGQGQKIGERELLETAFNEIRKSSHLLSSGEAEVVWTYGDLLCNQDGDAAKGLPYLREGLEASRRTADPKDPQFQNKLTFFARATEAAGDLQGAERIWRESVQQAEREFDGDHIVVAEFKKGQAGFLRRRGRAVEAFPLIEGAAPIYHRVLGANHQATVDADMLRAETLDQLGRTEEAADLYATLYQRWATFFPNPGAKAREKCGVIAQFFMRERRYEQAKAAFETLRGSFEVMPPKNGDDFETCIQVAGVTKGWPAAAELGRQQFERFADSATACRTMATVFLYVGDGEAYRKVTAKAFELASTPKRWPDRQAILSVAVLGTNVFSLEQLKQCELLIQWGEQALATATTNQQYAAHRALGAMLLRLGRLTNSLEHLDHAAQKYPSGINLARTLMLKAICLHGLKRTEEARKQFDDAEAMMKASLLDRLRESENFLAQDERTYLIYRREAQALLGLK